MRALRRVADPAGPANDDALHLLTSTGARTVAAWGAGGRLHGRWRAVAPLLDRPLCLETNPSGRA